MLPILLELPWLTIYSYPLFVGLGFGAAYHLLGHYLDQLELSHKLAPLFFGCFMTAWIGGKLFFLVYSSGPEASVHAKSLNFWLGGGMVFYGGLLGATLFVLTYSLVFRLYPASQLHLLLPPLALGHAVGRLGCLMAGCCYGIVAEVPWSVYLHGEDVHPVPAYEALGLCILGVALHKLVKGGRGPRVVITVYALSYSMLRFGLEFLRGDKIRGIHAYGCPHPNIFQSY